MVKNPAFALIDFLGSKAAVASRFSITEEAVRLWTKVGIPPDRALDVQLLTRGAVSAMDVLVFARRQRRGPKADA